MAEQGDPIERPAIYRTLVVVFAVWAAHFMVAYGAALVFPGQPLAGWIAITALLVAIAALFAWVRRIGRPRPPLALAAMGLAGAAIVLGTFPAIVG
ncbi:hypothetical protein U4960_14435 [Altererythrobacter sp. H2]|uniref:hypothetical protein n=1 Tax=Altererythrobacter sp. H2 TaxID=3108391 RepID=UPI002B4C0A7C|nr:hypothetical protein [Altererythrobacter sp. H2]WRK95461.1 hypothetical protein U4960_14435 [Altererythrobacter sp. H2]